jgi:hypothetical protein
MVLFHSKRSSEWLGSLPQRLEVKASLSNTIECLLALVHIVPVHSVNVAYRGLILVEDELSNRRLAEKFPRNVGDDPLVDLGEGAHVSHDLVELGYVDVPHAGAVD